ncbi:MAG: hypothetical protein JO328_17890 [Hyphomicrobiales bacterium]|nr:hypothetical protein [Hyphomicrobiales bacterium]MBV8825816.1 hypothetical protein [Hyphomicrobiales bacterium]
MLNPRKRRTVTSAVAILIVWSASVIGVNSQPADQALASDSSRQVQERAMPADLTEDELTAIFLRMEHDLARRQASSSPGSKVQPAAADAFSPDPAANIDGDVTSDPRRIGGLY